MTTESFQERIWEKGRELFRAMPWRETTDPYAILVSELMLQQTQVDRVRPKFEAFLTRFPDVKTLAKAPLADVLVLWSGLGYNRRARFLHETAKRVMADFGGQMPDNETDLVSLPGVGINTARAILAYAYNRPVVFIETNIRTVYFFHFFTDEVSVSDAELREVVAATLDTEHPREWYWALMDYGAFLKKSGASQLDKSRHYKKQSVLKGSLRETRGAILKYLAQHGTTPVTSLHSVIMMEDRFGRAIAGLERDGLIIREGEFIRLP